MICLRILAAAVILILSSGLRGAGVSDFPPVAGVIDRQAFAQWMEGRETPIPDEAVKGGAQAILWTPGGAIPDWRGVKFGEGHALGVRHLRIAFKEPLLMGSVLVRGGGTLSVLKTGAPAPGDLANDAQWTPATRLVNGAESRAEVNEEGYALWVLPPGTKTRALRFSHVPSPSDRESAGWLGGLWINEQRLANVAPQGLAQSAARDDFSAKLIDESNNHQWQTWDNGPEGAVVLLSKEHPEVITLTWPKAITLSGVCLLWTGFSAVEIDAFAGGPKDPTQGAPEANWHLTGSQSGMDALYPMALGPHWIAFPQPVLTRALRLRIIQGAKSGHAHLVDKVKDGRRVWLGELMALAPLAADATLASVAVPKAGEEPPPIGINFTLPEAGEVTLVIDDAQHHRVRNLVSETPFPAGKNTAFWDGSDDLLRDPEAARHGVYHLPTRLVAPGAYQVRGLWHRLLQLRYEFSVYNAGHPAWETADKTGCWMTTHTPPTSVAAVPGSRTADGQPLIFIGAYVAEGGHGLQWLHEDGTKLGGQGWVGGTWTGAPTLAVDTGEKAIAAHLCYVGSIWEGELRLTAKTRAYADQSILKQALGEELDSHKRDAKAATVPPLLEGFDGGDRNFVLGGIAAHNGTLVASLVRQNQLLVVDLATGKITSRVALDNPRGLAFDREHRLLVLSGRKLVRLATFTAPAQTIVASGLEDPRQLAVTADGRILITDRGAAHQVKIFSPTGQLAGSIGAPGPPAACPYNPLHLNNPNGLAVDSQGRVWVAEADNQPRRVSVWSGEGKLVRAFYGPTEYGGGGTLDPQDRTRFYYKGLEFRLDWKSGTDALTRVYARPNPLLAGHFGPYSPDTPLYPAGDKGGRYFTSCYTHTPTNGDPVAFVWQDGATAARLVAALGDARAWPVLRGEEFLSHWPAGIDANKEQPKAEDAVVFAWTDANHDGQPQSEEVQFLRGTCHGVTVMNDLAFVVARFGESSGRFAATLDAGGLPHYELSHPDKLGPAGGLPASSGGDQALTEPGGWSIATNASLPFSPYGLGGSFRGEPRWSYPSPWPGLHASHEAAVPDRPGIVVGHTRLLGGFLHGKAGPMFCVNGNMGDMYLFTADGLFVSTLFHDIRLRPNWAAPMAVRDMDVTEVSLHDENFWPSITQTADGKVFLVDGGRTSLVRVDGLDTLAPLPKQTISVSAAQLEQARQWFARREEARQQERGSGLLKVPLRKTAPKVDGTLDDWPAETEWAFIDRRGTKANFNSQSRPYEVSAAVSLSGTHLYAAWRTSEKDLLTNSGETPQALFKHGGCLDLMLGTDAAASPDRTAPVAGDERLLITRVQGKPRALLYRAKVPGAPVPVSFSSPWRTVQIDVVEDVTEQLTLASDNAGNFEIGIPLSALHWQPQPGAIYRADLGVLRGSNGQTTQRVYWSNKATAITADVPSEAELTPRLWGKWQIVGE